ncbi:hypothetical protein FZEAL_4742 [Fusarium zealandicum]|uniref:DUF7721 domain-containing protein n=1 Tax=Fusarium zealandicum TaxID=1053134 RepID=A0A8H4XLJ9_9HYPO|nr:hypothetical protein FZEAL_4742 [Fusarium zealandicum]
MDKLVNAAKDFLDDDKDKRQEQQQYGDQQQQYGQQQQQYGQQQQHGQEQQYPPPGGIKSQGGGGISSFFGDLDVDNAKEEASKNAGSSGDKDLFSSILGSLGQKQDKLANEDLDEEDAIRKHKKTYDDDENDQDDRSMGTAAAMQALKLFNKGETQSSSNSQSAFLGLAMAEASKLFDSKASQGKVSSDSSKESVVQQAGEVAMKMYFKNQGQQQGGLMGLASKFIK